MFPVPMRTSFVATCPPGLEALLAEELRELGVEVLVDDAARRRGAVAFTGPLEAGYRAVLWSRVASRVLLALEVVDAGTADALYEGARALPWADHLSVDRTFAVTAVGASDAGDDRRFLALRTKDAIVDALRASRGRRPDVDRAAPDVGVHVWLDGARATVSIDLSGEALHRRGRGRRDGGAAPVKENVAAALLRFVGWPARAGAGAPLVDPMCGSGTLLLEAARIARDEAPGLGRRRLGPEGWLGHDPALAARLEREAEARRAAARGRPLALVGHDASGEAVERARRNLARAGLGDVPVRVGELDDLAPPDGVDPGVVVVNPPYGARLGDEITLGPLHGRLGDVLRRRFLGWTVGVLTGSPRLAKAIGLRPEARLSVLHGGLDARFLRIPIAAHAPAGAGPGWRRPSEDAVMLANRLRKNLRRLRPAARREGVTCFRVYDRDVPEYAFTVDLYEDEVHLQEWAPPRRVSAAAAERHRADALAVVPEALGVGPDAVHFAARVRGPGQYGKRATTGHRKPVREAGLRFFVDLDDYLDSGLFLDQRRVRGALRDEARGKRFLNLFAYTCTATVYAAAGGATRSTSVDLSRTYLDWGRDNLAANDLDVGDAHRFVRADVRRFLEGDEGPWDLVYCAPPTFSRSKAMEGDFDLARDHGALLEAVARRLAPGGVVIFGAPGRRFALDPAVERRYRVDERTEAFTPFDFRKARDPARTWRLERR